MDQKPRHGEQESHHPGNVAYTSSIGKFDGAAALRELIEEKRREADRYEALLNALPRKLPPEADFALQLMVAKASR